ncbi:MAG: tripartite tricarboxylate transporter substrate-binding protein [Dehalococcoidia bacterium]|nr:tripartite tricarboxylate transporter substrate-binding protein [Dehalococcoidia bacterium]
MKVNKLVVAIFSVILILGLLASACGPKAEPTQAPAPARPAPTAAVTTAPPVPGQPTAAPTRPPVAAPTAAPRPTESPMDKAAAFYKGKTVQLVAPYSPGGGYDLWARIMAPYLAKHLGATVIVKNEPGASAKVAVNRLQKENNGLSIVIFNPVGALTAQIYGLEGANFDLGKFNWLATGYKLIYPVVVGKKSGYKTVADLQKAPEVKFGTDAIGGGKTVLLATMGRALDINVKLVVGYGGTADQILAVQRGEVDGFTTGYPAIKPSIESGDLIPVFVMDQRKIKDFPDVPSIYEVKNLSPAEKRTVDTAIALDPGRPIATTPGVPAERVAFLEAAIRKTLEEPGVIEKIRKIGEDVEYVGGKDTAELMNTLLDMGAEDKTTFGKLLGIKGY